MKVFLINLAGSTERFEKSNVQLSRFDIEFERVCAVNGAKLKNEEIARHYSPEQNKAKYYKSLTVGEIGCYLSHRKVWEEIVENEIPSAIILEDDFLITEELTNAISDIESIQSSWDYIKLAGYKKRKRKSYIIEKLKHFSLVEFKKIPAGTCAQAVSLNGAKKLLETTDKFGRPIDIDLQHWWERKVHIQGLSPFPFEPNENEESDIGRLSNRKEVRRHRLRRVKQQLAFKIRNAYERKFSQKID